MLVAGWVAVCSVDGQVVVKHTARMEVENQTLEDWLHPADTLGVQRGLSEIASQLYLN